MDPTELTDGQGRVLLRIARCAVAEALGIEPGAATAVTPDEAWLHTRRASFVTLTQDRVLRGCIGTVHPRDTLIEDLRKNALSAALSDPRFPPLRAEELGRTRFEVSLLSALQPLRAESEAELLHRLEPGVHGVVLEVGSQRGLFLPQMWEPLPEPQRFLAHLKRKAGLPPDFWSPDVVLWTFTVQAWEEEEKAAAAPPNNGRRSAPT